MISNFEPCWILESIRAFNGAQVCASSKYLTSKENEMKTALALILLLFAMPTTSSAGSLPSVTSRMFVDSNTTGIVLPGKSKTNTSGVKLTNDEDSKGNATITPRRGERESKTTIKTRPKFKGSVEGLNNNDEVNVAGGSEITIAGYGGTVNLQPNSVTTVKNNGNAGGPEIVVVLPDGSSFGVPPGSEATDITT